MLKPNRDGFAPSVLDDHSHRPAGVGPHLEALAVDDVAHAVLADVLFGAGTAAHRPVDETLSALAHAAPRARVSIPWMCLYVRPQSASPQSQ
jgi:hypothetical protein